MATEAPWVMRPLGALPTRWQDHLRVVAYAVRDLPRAQKEDQLTELAAAMSFYLLFSVFPFLLFLITLLPHLPPRLGVDRPVLRLLEILSPILPAEVHALILTQLENLVTQPRAGIATLSVLVTLYSASRALVSLSRALNRTYRVPKIRSELLRRMRSMGITLALMASLILTVVALSLGDRIIDWLVASGLLTVDKGTVITVTRWPFLLLLASFLVQQLYYLLPDVRRRWRAVSTGSVVAILGWVVGTWAFSSLAGSFFRSNVAYGSLGSVVVLLAWLYLGSLTLMLGASLNALIERGLPADATNAAGDTPTTGEQPQEKEANDER